jgi:hypothetical protein
LQFLYFNSATSRIPCSSAKGKGKAQLTENGYYLQLVCEGVHNLIHMLRKATNIVLTLIGAFTLGIPSATASLNIGISPPRIETEINGKNRTQTVRVINVSSEPVEIKAYVRSWKLNQDNKMEEIPSTEDSLDRWIVYTPAQFTIPPRGTQTIRFAIRPRVQPKVGEHRAVLYLEEVSSSKEASKGLSAIARMGVTIYGYVGDIKRVGVLNSVTVDPKPNASKALFDVSSIGNGYVRMKGQYAIWPAAKYPGARATKPVEDLGKLGKKLPENLLDIGSLPLSPVLPDTRSRLVLPITQKLPPGKYVLDINGELNGVQIDQGIPFTVPVAPVATQPPTRVTASRNLRNRLRNR